MDRSSHFSHPVLIVLLIGVFFYLYFVYLRGAETFLAAFPSVGKVNPNGEVETTQAEPNRAEGVRPEFQPESPIQQLNPPNVIEHPSPWVVAPPDPNVVGLAGSTALATPPNSSSNGPIGLNPSNQTVVRVAKPGSVLSPLAEPNASLQPIAGPFKTLQEGHWIGLEAIPLTPTLAEANSIPPEVKGVLIDEVTLLSAEAGFLAGDVILAVNGKPVTDLKSFRQATLDLGTSNRATVSVFSGGQKKDILVFSTAPLGMAQVEAAPMILATDRPPHGFRGPCERCHTVSKTPLNTGQLAKDLGDTLTKVAPTIRRGTPPPHGNRGTCTSCHVVL